MVRDMRRAVGIVLLLIAVAGIGGGIWWYTHRPAPDDGLVLYGNVDFRQAALAFNGAERIAQILVEEGDIVHKGEVLARLDTSRLEPKLAQAEAAVAALEAALRELQHGSRPQEIAQARADLAAAKADAANADAQYARKRALAATSTASRQDVDIARAAAGVAAANVAVAQSALDLAIAGPRAEDIAQAAAQLRGSEAQRDLVRQELRDAALVAPFDAIVRSRLMEPGEMAATTRPVLSLAARGTKWIRAYVAEQDLGHLRPGMPASVTTDSFPDQPLDGWIGFISPVAEFTPKTVQTEDLRTSLVYEVRVFVDDPQDRLRLGMPATVRLLPDSDPEAEQPKAAP
jgi:HlyD family secretion protein